jgi:hypothetical protein
VRTLVLLVGILGALILAAAFLRCSRLRHARPARATWARDLAIAIQASLFVFCVAGAALSMAYYDLFIIEIALLLPLREIILPERKQKRPKWAPPHVAALQ